MKDLGATDIILGLKIESIREELVSLNLITLKKFLRDLTILIANLLALLLILVADL